MLLPNPYGRGRWRTMVENPQNGWGTSGFSPDCSKKGSSISIYGVNRLFIARRNIFKQREQFSYNRGKNQLEQYTMMCIAIDM